ncbi:UPF0328 protein [Frankliniella fusca]|uniref:UPF0328 protein n=1 Tax=Frankliniella fusca TaxID=407009 RepID=A0AAE1LI69_9NEOP|nr:UPF0328 protein [Frankliniella fusca]
MLTWEKAGVLRWLLNISWHFEVATCRPGSKWKDRVRRKLYVKPVSCLSSFPKPTAYCVLIWLILRSTLKSYYYLGVVISCFSFDIECYLTNKGLLELPCLTSVFEAINRFKPILGVI